MKFTSRHMPLAARFGRRYLQEQVGAWARNPTFGDVVSLHRSGGRDSAIKTADRHIAPDPHEDICNPLTKQ